MKIKTFINLVLIIAMTGISATAQEEYYGVNDNAQRIDRTDSETYFMVHGGCREYNNNPALTEIWLYVSRAANTEYNPGSSQVLRGTMYLERKYESVESTAICSFFRKALEKQIPMKMKLVTHPYWSNHFLVKSLNKKQVYDNLELIEENTLLENFSVRRKELHGN